MKNRITAPVVADAWGPLRRFTPARIALGRAGGSLPTGPHLAFQFAHARARDAVHRPLPVEALQSALSARGYRIATVRSAAPDRATYLKRPDLGRRLDDASRARLEAYRGADAAEHRSAPIDVAFVVADGLSALAIERNALPFLDRLLPRLGRDWSVAPLVIAEQARVALGDDVAVALGARMVVVLIGERPGLSSPDSMGLYLTWAPAVGTTDAHRNCISNVREEGMGAEQAAHKLRYLMTQARARRLSGVRLKDEADAPARLTDAPARNFLSDGG